MSISCILKSHYSDYSHLEKYIIYTEIQQRTETRIIRV